jgi:hypothetical protein
MELNHPERPVMDGAAIQVPAAVPADTLFPSWRGREPFADRACAASEALYRAHSMLADAVGAAPFEAFEALWHRDPGGVTKYNHVPDEAGRMIANLPEALRAPWLCALMLWHISRFDGVFRKSGLHPEFALHYADAFHRILDQIETDPAFATLSSDIVLKDLWILRVVMVPAFAQIWWPHSGLAAGGVLRAGPAAAAYVFLRCGGRRPLFEGHTHDPMAKAYWNEAGWREALRLAALALPAFPKARGVFGTAWFYDPAIQDVSPRIVFAQDLQVGKGAVRIKIGTNDAAVRNATATSASRRNRYRDGSYVPTDYAIIWSRGALAEAYGPSAPSASAAGSATPALHTA